MAIQNRRSRGNRILNNINTPRPLMNKNNLYDSAINNETMDTRLSGGGGQYQAPGSNLDPLGVGDIANFAWTSPTQFGGGNAAQGWTPPWGGNLNTFNEWLGGAYDDWLANSGESPVGSWSWLSGLAGDSIEDYFGSLSGGGVPSYAGWLNYYQGDTSSPGPSGSMMPGSGGNIGGAGDLLSGSLFSGMGYGPHAGIYPNDPSFSGYPGWNWEEGAWDCEPYYNSAGECIACCG